MQVIRGIRKFRQTGEVLMRILGELAEVYGKQIPVTLAIDKAIEAGVPEETVKSTLKECKKYGAVVSTGPNTIKLSLLMESACKDLVK